jgi:hypothetical protein
VKCGGAVAKSTETHQAVASPNTNAKKTMKTTKMTTKHAKNNEEERIKNSRCCCCKERGHLTIACTNDPNMRTTTEIEEEFFRVLRLEGGIESK